MTRTLPGSMGTSVAAKITDPVWLIDLKFASWTYWSSRELVDYGGNSYAQARLEVLSITPTETTFRLANHDRAISALALAGQIRENPVIVGLYYNGDYLQYWEGEIDSFDITDDRQGNWVTFTCVAMSARDAVFPRDRMIPSATSFNHVPPSGSTIKWGANYVILESSE